jgi:hypothetical protein
MNGENDFGECDIHPAVCARRRDRFHQRIDAQMASLAAIAFLILVCLCYSFGCAQSNDQATKQTTGQGTEQKTNTTPSTLQQQEQMAPKRLFVQVIQHPERPDRVNEDGWKEDCAGAQIPGFPTSQPTNEPKGDDHRTYTVGSITVNITEGGSQAPNMGGSATGTSTGTQTASQSADAVSVADADAAHPARDLGLGADRRGPAGQFAVAAIDRHRSRRERQPDRQPDQRQPGELHADQYPRDAPAIAGGAGLSEIDPVAAERASRCAAAAGDSAECAVTRRIEIEKDLTVRAPTIGEAKQLLDSLIGEGDGWVTVKGNVVLEVTGEKKKATT